MVQKKQKFKNKFGKNFENPFPWQQKHSGKHLEEVNRRKEATLQKHNWDEGCEWW